MSLCRLNRRNRRERKGLALGLFGGLAARCVFLGAFVDLCFRHAHNFLCELAEAIKRRIAVWFFFDAHRRIYLNTNTASLVSPIQYPLIWLSLLSSTASWVT